MPKISVWFDTKIEAEKALIDFKKKFSEELVLIEQGKRPEKELIYAKSFLTRFLHRKEVARSIILKEARKRNISSITLRRAFSRLKRLKKTKKGSEWFYYLPACSPGRTALHQKAARDLLKDLLAGGYMRSTIILKIAKKERVGIGSLRRAGRSLGVLIKKRGRIWYWSLPKDCIDLASIEKI